LPFSYLYDINQKDKIFFYFINFTDMKKKLLFFLIALLPAIAAMSQTTAPGFRVTYITEVNERFSQTFPLDSVIDWGFSTGDVFIKTVSHGEIRMWSGYLVKVEYPELRLTPPSGLPCGSGRFEYDGIHCQLRCFLFGCKVRDDVERCS
jgi:hypothetical protein